MTLSPRGEGEPEGVEGVEGFVLWMSARNPIVRPLVGLRAGLRGVVGDACTERERKPTVSPSVESEDSSSDVWDDLLLHRTLSEVDLSVPNLFFTAPELDERIILGG